MTSQTCILLLAYQEKEEDDTTGGTGRDQKRDLLNDKVFMLGLAKMAAADCCNKSLSVCAVAAK